MTRRMFDSQPHISPTRFHNSATDSNPLVNHWVANDSSRCEPASTHNHHATTCQSTNHQATQTTFQRLTHFRDDFRDGAHRIKHFLVQIRRLKVFTSQRRLRITHAPHHTRHLHQPIPQHHNNVHQSKRRRQREHEREQLILANVVSDDNPNDETKAAYANRAVKYQVLLDRFLELAFERELTRRAVLLSSEMDRNMNNDVKSTVKYMCVQRRKGVKPASTARSATSTGT